MSRTPEDSARRQADRIAVLEGRMRQLTSKYHKTPQNISEISAIEWAVPILEKHLADTFGETIMIRANYYKHERRAIKNKLWDTEGDICYLCQQSMTYRQATIDHVIPLSKGGADDISNYKLTHPRCNLEKGNMLLEVYLIWRVKHYGESNLA